MFAQPSKFIPAPQAADIAAIDAFVGRLNDKHGAARVGEWFLNSVGPKYVRIMHKVDPRHEGGSAYAFVERATGYIFKPDGWTKPAKHARGAIHDESNGLDCCGAFGVAYMR